jgi:hypothetical protein
MARLGIPYYIVPAQVPNDRPYSALYYSFEADAAHANAEKLTKKTKQPWRVVRVAKRDPTWMGSELNALPDA